MVSHSKIIPVDFSVQGNPYEIISDLQKDKQWLEYEIDMLKMEIDKFNLEWEIREKLQANKKGE